MAAIYVKALANNLAIRRPNITGRFRSLFSPEVWLLRGITDANLQRKRKYYNQRLADFGEDQYLDLTHSSQFLS